MTSTSPPTDARRAVILLSGGLDSATAAAVAREAGFSCYGLTVSYGQRHTIEIDCARRVADALGLVEHKVITVDLGAIGGSALTSDALEVPDAADHPSDTIPITYVPARNTILLSIALAWAEVLGAWDIYIGANAVDYSGYPDCRPAFIAAFEHLANVATAAGVQDNHPFTIHAPLIDMTKADIIRTGTRLGVDYSLTHSCYHPAPDGTACGVCDSCSLRLKGFREARLTDPVRYKKRGKK